MTGTNSQQLTAEGVFQALEAAGSQDNAAKREFGENQLKNWEILPRFHEFLQVSNYNSSKSPI